MPHLHAPYVEEVGADAKETDLEQYVAKRDMRPRINDNIREHSTGKVLVRLIEEMWDKVAYEILTRALRLSLQDPEARISAPCALTRLENIKCSDIDDIALGHDPITKPLLA